MPRRSSSANGIPCQGCMWIAKTVTEKTSGGILRINSGPCVIYQLNAPVSNGLINGAEIRLRANNTMARLKISSG